MPLNLKRCRPAGMALHALWLALLIAILATPPASAVPSVVLRRVRRGYNLEQLICSPQYEPVRIRPLVASDRQFRSWKEFDGLSASADQTKATPKRWGKLEVHYLKTTALPDLQHTLMASAKMMDGSNRPVDGMNKHQLKLTNRLLEDAKNVQVICKSLFHMHPNRVVFHLSEPTITEASANQHADPHHDPKDGQHSGQKDGQHHDPKDQKDGQHHEQKDGHHNDQKDGHHNDQKEATAPPPTDIAPRFEVKREDMDVLDNIAQFYFRHGLARAKDHWPAPLWSHVICLFNHNTKGCPLSDKAPKSPLTLMGYGMTLSKSAVDATHRTGESLTLDEATRHYYSIMAAVAVVHEHKWVHQNVQPSHFVYNHRGNTKLGYYRLRGFDEAQPCPKAEDLVKPPATLSVYRDPALKLHETKNGNSTVTRVQCADAMRNDWIGATATAISLMGGSTLVRTFATDPTALGGLKQWTLPEKLCPSDPKDANCECTAFQNLVLKPLVEPKFGVAMLDQEPYYKYLQWRFSCHLEVEPKAHGEVLSWKEWHTQYTEKSGTFLRLLPEIIHSQKIACKRAAPTPAPAKTDGQVDAKTDGKVTQVTEDTKTSQDGATPAAEKTGAKATNNAKRRRRRLRRRGAMERKAQRGKSGKRRRRR
ncbi:hypothetical protein CXG81DRAFT_18241 [Caulochytrium protostelioides]|uniref:Protein kinase domain-containing protein n=1 Tax=Caulochytrium protostelioides TaxID=1555241 RepID=A0A4V1IUX4_9FUNG|nr:hypothetical protein CXG81DRAFT_18241 [Caulochytrium protostelioides]|eukprot:RKP02069.1 hypothetical protein CXG81DRAFT_18241 [Caulochytrium protostelioides]